MKSEIEEQRTFVSFFFFLKNLARFPDSSVGKESTCSAGDIRDTGSVPGSGRSPGGGHGNPLQYSCLENPMDRGTWWASQKDLGMTEAT